MKRGLLIGAHAIAAGSLAMLGWQSFQPVPTEFPARTEMTLWTAGAAATAPTVGTQVALPDAAHPPAGAERIPDLGFLRRNHPVLQRVVIEGDGIDATGAAALSGLAVVWNRPMAARHGAPAITAVSAPRVLTVGQRMTVQGCVRGLRPGDTIALSLEGPDGASQSVETKAAPDGDGTFSLVSAAAAIAAGAFEWKLRLGPGGEPLVLGAMVVKPELPRVLLLQASPSVEGGRLQRWLAEAGAPVTSRTRVSADRVRFAAASGSPAEIASIDAPTLENFDVVIAREDALAELDAGERTALDEMIRKAGIGLLVVGEAGGDWAVGGASHPDPSRDKPAPTATKSFSAPWEIRTIDGGGDADENRLARLRLRDGTELAEPITVVPAEILAPPAGRWLVRDTRGRTLGVAIPHGSGWVARSLVNDTWRWLQSGHPEIFATYWSAVLSAIARAATPPGGRWNLGNGTGPIFVDEAVRLLWLGAPTGTLPAAEVRPVGEPNASATPLQLARDSAGDSRAEALHWPAQAGWHEVRTLPAGETMAFYVQPREALSELRAEHRRDATARLSAGGLSQGSAARARGEGRARPGLAPHACFALFVVSAGWLWLEQRR